MAGSSARYREDFWVWSEMGARLGLPRGLSAIGILPAMIPDLAAHTVDDMCTA